MRITPEILWKVAKDTASQQAQANRDILAIFLHGSMLKETALLGGTADIDLFIVHSSDNPANKREIIRMTDDVTLDIAHFNRSDFRYARELRHDPWLGSTIYGAKTLFDPNHFMDFVQASVRGQFNQPVNVQARSRKFSEKARQIWLSLEERAISGKPAEILEYLEAVQQAANAIASLNGPPLTERRMLLEFPSRASLAGHPGVCTGFYGVLGAASISREEVQSWLPLWMQAYEAIQGPGTPIRMNRSRSNYYRKAVEVMLEGEQYQAAIWPLLTTWTLAANLLPENSPALDGWQGLIEKLGLTGENLTNRLAALDAYLDTIEEILDEWAKSNGV